MRLFPLKERCLEGDGYRLYYWTHLLYRTAISTPFRDRLALEWEGAVQPSGLELASLAIRTRCSDVVFKDVGMFVSGIPGPGTGLVQEYVNCDVSLDEGLEQGFGRSARKNFRRAQEDYGLTVDVNPRDAFEDFYRLYLASRRQLGVLPYPRKFFWKLFDYIGDAVVMFRCNSPEGVLGYLICSLYGPEMISSHLAYRYEQRQKRITDFLFMNAFQWGRRNGFSTYRFGADSLDQASLLRSKLKLGGVSRPQWDYHLRPALKAEDRPDSVVRRLLRAMPMPLFRHTGKLTGLYFR